MTHARNTDLFPEPVTKQAAKAKDMIAPKAGNPRLLTSGAKRTAASAADLAPHAPRPGSGQADACPSRFGNHLHHRSGLITDLQGNVIQKQ